MSDISFEWDPEKADSNLRKHKVSFERAASVFAGPMIETVDDREDYGETRWIALGLTAGQVLRVVFTVRPNGNIRLISAQKANAHDQKTYYSRLFPH